AAASLAGLPPVRADQVLAELVQAHLVGEPVSGRYALHDLLRAYAGEVGATVEAGAPLATARLRLLDHYLHTAHVATQRLVPHLARAHVRLGHYADAHRYYGYALTLFARLGDRAGQAHTHLDLGWVFEREHRYREALQHTRRALKLYRLVGDAGWQGRALNAAGWYHA